MNTKIKLSLIIPAYNEENLIISTLKNILSFLKNKRYLWEIIIVDDGSNDKTFELTKKFDDPRVHIFRLDTNMGKGAALREGVSKARGEHIIFTDADLSVSIDNIDLFLAELEKGYDVAIGSRRVAGAKIAEHQSWLRENMGRGFTLLTQIATGTNLADYTCGFKGFKNIVAKDIFSRSVINRWAYDAEILYLANKLKYKIKQMPVTWINRKDSRVVLQKVILETFRDLIEIRINDLLGKYAR